jgi:hypothetical protein
MLVRATKIGYLNHLRHYPADHAHRRAGESFEVGEEIFRLNEDHTDFVRGKDGLPVMPRWMELVDPKDLEQFKDIKPQAETAEKRTATATMEMPKRRGRPPKNERMT